MISYPHNSSDRQAKDAKLWKQAQKDKTAQTSLPQVHMNFQTHSSDILRHIYKDERQNYSQDPEHNSEIVFYNVSLHMIWYSRMCSSSVGPFFKVWCVLRPPLCLILWQVYLDLQFPGEKLVSCSCSGFSRFEVAVAGMEERPGDTTVDFWNGCLRSEPLP